MIQNRKLYIKVIKVLQNTSMSESQPDNQFNCTLACVFLNYNNVNTKLMCKFIITITPNIIFYFTIIIDFCLYFLNFHVHLS